MRFLLFFIVILLSCPAWAAFNGPSVVAQKELTTVMTALDAPEGTTCILTGNIIEHIKKDRYSFKDSSGTITVNIPPHVFGSLDVTPRNSVRITGEIRGKRDIHRTDAHLGVRYLEVLN